MFTYRRKNLVGFEIESHNIFYDSRQGSDIANVISSNSFFIKLDSENLAQFT